MNRNGGRIENDGLNDGDTYVDLEDDSIEIIETKKEHLVSEAVKNSLSKKGERELEEIIKNNKPVFKVRLGSEGPAKVKPMRIVLHPSRKLGKVKVRKYLIELRMFLYACFSKLEEMKFLKPYP